MFPCSVLILIVWILSFLLLVNWAKDLPILFIFSKSSCQVHRFFCCLLSYILLHYIQIGYMERFCSFEFINIYFETQDVVYFGKASCVAEWVVYLALGGILCRYLLSPFGARCQLILMIFCWFFPDLSIKDSGILRSLTIIELMLICVFKFSSTFYDIGCSRVWYMCA